MVIQIEIKLPSYSKGYHLLTRFIEEQLPDLPKSGLLHILIKHTSAAITLNENADPKVRKDFSSFFSRMIPENAPYFEHVLEGGEDMPAHIKASLLGQELTIPIKDYKLELGTWQGIYFCEFRKEPIPRHAILTIIS